MCVGVGMGVRVHPVHPGTSYSGGDVAFSHRNTGLPRDPSHPHPHLNGWPRVPVPDQSESDIGWRKPHLEPGEDTSRTDRMCLASLKVLTSTLLCPLPGVHVPALASGGLTWGVGQGLF